MPDRFHGHLDHGQYARFASPEPIGFYTRTVLPYDHTRSPCTRAEGSEPGTQQTRPKGKQSHHVWSYAMRLARTGPMIFSKILCAAVDTWCIPGTSII